MFSNQSNTPFGQGGGGFSQSANTTPAFGSPAPAPTGLFGSTAPNPAFGSPPGTSAPFGGSTFGSTAPAPGLFGAAPAPPPAFGGAPSAPFGSTQQPAPFGAPSPAAGGGLFGAPSPAPFGAPAGGGLFGAPAPAPTTPFGAPAPSAFGAAPAPSAFGAPSTGGFGSTTSTFGAAPAGGTSLFGAPAPTAPFGAAAAPAAPFGAPAPSAPFGSPTAAPFGTAGAPAPFGAPPASGGLFGAAQAPAPGGGLFGATTPTAAGAGGTRQYPFTQTSKPDGTNTINLQSISAMAQYEASSFEELRLADYKQGNRGTSTPQAAPAPGGSFFGSQPAAAPTTGLFGAAPGPAPFGGGAPAQAPFGAAPAPFGAAPAPFGSPAPAPFGAAPAPFGSPAPAPFGAPAPATGGLFGAPSTAPATSTFGAAPSTGTSLFGAAAPAPFGAPAPSTFGGFGSTTTPAPAPFGQAPAPGTGGLFGTTTPAPAPFGQAPAPATAGLFGAPAPAFGAAPAPATPGLFGAPAAGTGLFGATPAPAPTSTFGFGAAPAPATSLFGQQPAAPAPFGMPAAPAPAFGAAPPAAVPPAAGGFPVNATIVPQVANEVLDQQMRALQQQRKEMEQYSAWGTNGTTNGNKSPSVGGASTTPTSQRESDSLFFGSSNRPSYSPMVTATPRSGTKIRPRGFATEPTLRNGARSSNATMMTPLGTDNRALMTPDAHARSSSLTLVVRPATLQRMTQPRARLQLENKTPTAAVKETQQQPTTTTSPTAEQQQQDASRSSPPVGVGDVTAPPPEDVTPVPVSRETQSPGAATTPTAASAAAPLPATSPGLDYYQQVTGAVDSTAAAPSSQPATPTASASAVPKLDKDGYIVTPSVQDMATMSEADLAAVAGFSVKRPGYGMVEWEGAVDVRGADLNSIVVIEHRNIEVYASEEERGEKPPVGSKLNRPAQLTFFDVFPTTGGAEASDEAKSKMASKVTKTTRKLGAELISYDKESGVWKIRVVHFSRYGFDDDDDSEDEARPSSSKQAAVQQVQQQPQTPNVLPLKRKSVASRKATPFKPSRVGMQDDMDFSESYGTDSDAALVSDGEYDNKYEASRVTAEQVDREIQEQLEAASKGRQSVSWAPSLSKQPPPQPVSFEDEGIEDDFDSGSSAAALPVPPSTALLGNAASSTSSITRRLARKAKMASSSVDMGMRMRGSFRVCWLPDGSFFKPGQAKHGPDPTLVKCRPVYSTEATTENSVDLLESFLDNSTKIAGGDNACPPLYTLPSGQENFPKLQQALRAFAASAQRSDDVRFAFLLISSLLCIDGVEHGTESMKARQMAAVLQFLIQLCGPEVSKEIESSRLSNDWLSAIFAALSGGDVEQACLLAEEAGFLHLYSALSVGSEGRKDIIRQLGHMADNGMTSEVSPTCQRILKSLGGDAKFENSLYRQGRSTLDWRRRVALRIWQGLHTDLPELIRNYEQQVSTGDVPFPSPRYAASAPSRHPGVQDLLFKLLKHFALDESSPAAAIAPTGFTPWRHDFAMSFHLASAVCAASTNANLSPFEAEYVLNGYEAQLIADGHWEWAVVVALCTMGGVSVELERRKLCRAKNYVLRYFDGSDTSAKAFLEGRVGVPDTWFAEAIAYRSSSCQDYAAFMNQALSFDLSTAILLMEEKWLPELFFKTADEIQSNLPLVESFASAAPEESSLALAMYRYFQLDELLAAYRETHSDETRRLLEDNHEWVHGFLSKYQSRSLSSLLFPNDPTSKTSASMVSAALQNLARMRVEIKAISMNG